MIGCQLLLHIIVGIALLPDRDYAFPLQPRTTKHRCFFSAKSRLPRTKLLLSSSRVNGGTSIEKEMSSSSDDDDGDDTSNTGTSICRVVANSDAKIPAFLDGDSSAILAKISSSSSSLPLSSGMLRNLDSIYHAKAHQDARKYEAIMGDDGGFHIDNEDEERSLAELLRTSLEDAGFQLLSRRDLDLCEALNVGYLLRLSIAPDTSGLDRRLTDEFYPDGSFDPEELAELEGRVLLFWRGYSTEVSKGRLLMPKFDYLQANVVQRAASLVRNRLSRFESKVSSALLSGVTSLKNATITTAVNAAPQVLRDMYLSQIQNAPRVNGEDTCSSKTNSGDKQFFKFTRYGGVPVKFVGSPNIDEALTPFEVCEINGDVAVDPDAPSPSPNNSSNSTTFGRESKLEEPDVDSDVYRQLNDGNLTCQYDSETKRTADTAARTLLKRLSISNAVSRLGRERSSSLLNRFLEQSELIEPTYEEVVVVWRPLPPRPKRKFKVLPPKLVYQVAELFDVDDLLPPRPAKAPESPLPPLEIRTFNSVPMANLLAVLPKTRLVFRPADALLFDVTTVVTFLVLLSSFPFELPILAWGSLIFFIVRYFLKYSNRLARYDLLVKKFLTSKISHRNEGALRYIIDEAGSQRARRAALVHTWLLLHARRKPDQVECGMDVGAVGNEADSRDDLIKKALAGVNEVLGTDQYINVDVKAAFEDLEELKLIHFSGDGKLESVENGVEAERVLEDVWLDIFKTEGQAVNGAFISSEINSF